MFEFLFNATCLASKYRGEGKKVLLPDYFLLRVKKEEEKEKEEVERKKAEAEGRKD